MATSRFLLACQSPIPPALAKALQGLYWKPQLRNVLSVVHPQVEAWVREGISPKERYVLESRSGIGCRSLTVRYPFPRRQA